MGFGDFQQYSKIFDGGCEAQTVHLRDCIDLWIRLVQEIMASLGGGYFFTSPPKCNGNGGQEGAMWILKEEVSLSVRGLGPVLHARFDGELPGKEDGVLDITNHEQKKQSDTRKMNIHALACLTMAMETMEMLNMMLLGKKRDLEWPSGKFPTICNKIKKEFAPDNDVAEMDMEDNLWKIKCTKTGGPKKILNDIATIEDQYRCLLLDK